MMKKSLFFMVFIMFTQYVIAQSKIDSLIKDFNKPKKGTYRALKDAIKDPNNVLRLYLNEFHYKSVPTEILKFQSGDEWHSRKNGIVYAHPVNAIIVCATIIICLNKI